jgi:hypothetical protein
MTPSESAAVDDRIRMLNWRTVCVGWAASVVIVAAVVTSLRAVGELDTAFFGTGAVEGAAFHLPAALRHADGLPLLSLLFAGLALVGAWGLSTGRLRRSHGHVAFALCLLAGVADVFLASPLHQPLFGLPSEVERLVAKGRYADADRLVGDAGAGSMRQRQDYVRAQIAMRAGDTQRLEALGRPLLEAADDYVHAGSLDPGSAHVYFDAMGDLRVEVLAAIDRRLHGVPRSAAGMAVASAQSGLQSRELRAAAMTAAALGLIAAGGLLVALWRRMRANVLRIVDLVG